MVTNGYEHTYLQRSHTWIRSRTGLYPLVQIRLPSGHITEAVGSSMELSQTSTDWGGLIYAYNDSNFKLWSPNDRKGGIFSTADGWGKHGKLVHSGTVKMYAWKVLFALKTFQQTVTLPSIASTMDLKQNIDRDYDFIDVKVEALDGESQNFIFHASGAIQNIRMNDSIGGLVFAYSDSQFRFWYPKKGSLILVDQSWGKPNTQHTSQKAQVTVEINKKFKSCPPVTTRLTAKQLVTTNQILFTQHRQHPANTSKRTLVTKQQQPVGIINRTATTKQHLPVRTITQTVITKEQLPVRTTSRTVTTKQQPARTSRTVTTKQQPARTSRTVTTKQHLPVRTITQTVITKEQLPVRTTSRTVTTKQQPARTSRTVTTKQQPARTSQTVTTKQQPAITSRTVTTKQQPARTSQTVTTKQHLPVRTITPTVITKLQNNKWYSYHNTTTTSQINKPSSDYKYSFATR